MKIAIKNSSVCESCSHKTCALSDVVERTTFSKFKTERYTCPVRYLQIEPTDKQLEVSRIDAAVDTEGSGCIHCGLCVLSCSKANLEMQQDGEDLFGEFLNNSTSDVDGATNIVALSYLSRIFDFAANTTLNKALEYDGVVIDKNDNCYFVEVDVGDDSLETCRRILRDVVVHNHIHPDKKINAGIMILKSIPKNGSRDVFTVVKSIRNFPATTALNIYVTTFADLRRFSFLFSKNECAIQELLYDLTGESICEYESRIRKLFADKGAFENADSRTCGLLDVDFGRAADGCFADRSAEEVLDAAGLPQRQVGDDYVMPPEDTLS